MYLGYLLLRGMTEDQERASSHARVLGLIAVLDVQLVHFSVYRWRTLHQPPSVLKPGPVSMPAAILTAPLADLMAFILSAYFVSKRSGLLPLVAEAGP